MRRPACLILLAGLLVGPHTLSAQCSDAGVCSIGHRSPQRQSTFSLEYLFGRTSKTDDITVHTVRLNAQFPLFSQSALTISIPYSGQSGPLGSVSGIGDLTVVWTQELWSTGGFRWSANFGGRIALADVNAGHLPQAYQSGLGTNDLLAGFACQNDEWNIALGYQLSRGRSANTTTRLRRGDDVLFSIGYSNSLGALRATGEILAIKRLDNSSVVNLLSASPLPSYQDVPNSAQGQVNLVARADYPLSPIVTARAAIAVPLLKREVNVDGLTRSLTLTAGFACSL